MTNNSSKNFSSNQSTSASARSQYTPPLEAALKSSSTSSLANATSGKTLSTANDYIAFKFNTTHKQSKVNAKANRRFWGDFARVTFNNFDFAFSVSYKDAFGETHKSSGIPTLTLANQFARAIEAAASAYAYRGEPLSYTVGAPKSKNLSRRWESYVVIFTEGSREVYHD